MRSHTLGSAMDQLAPPSFRGRHGRTCFDTRRGAPEPSPRRVVAAIDGRPLHRGDGCSPVTGRQGGQPWRVLWASKRHRGLVRTCGKFNRELPTGRAGCPHGATCSNGVISQAIGAALEALGAKPLNGVGHVQAARFPFIGDVGGSGGDACLGARRSSGRKGSE
jgi:hypothetical protein